MPSNGSLYSMLSIEKRSLIHHFKSENPNLSLKTTVLESLGLISKRIGPDFVNLSWIFITPFNWKASIIEEIYELSELKLGFLTPNRTNFEDSKARFRGIHCYVYKNGEELLGTARGSKE